MQTSLNAQAIRHNINGIGGIMSARTTNIEGVITKQVFKSTRDFNEQGFQADSTITLEIRLDDSCKNGRELFRIVAYVKEPSQRDFSMSGCLDAEVERYFPEIAHLIKWHLTFTNGPMYYIENTTYHASNGDFEAARNCALWPEATDKELSCGKERLTLALIARKAGLMAEFFADMEKAGFFYKKA